MKRLVFAMLSILLLNASSAQVELPNTITSAEKVYGLAKFWQEVNYNFVFLDKVDRTEWEQTFQNLIEEVQQTANDYEYYRLLQRFCASLEDGHTNVYFPESVDSLIHTTFFGDYRLFITNIDGRAIVSRVNYSKKDEIPIGTEIIEVNGLATQDYADQFVKPYISSSTDYILEDWAISRLFRSPKGTQYDLKLKKPDGEVIALQLTHERVAEQEVYPPFADRELLDFKWIGDDIAYVSLNSFGNPKIDTLFIAQLPELRKAEKLIVDLRYNGGGNTNVGTEILQYLTYDNELYGSASQSRLHIPAFKAWGNWVSAKDTLNASEEDKQWIEQAYLSGQDNFFHSFPYEPTPIELPRKERVVVPTVLLIGNNTASAAEDFLIAADDQRHMTKIGEPTFGSTGQPLHFDLPGGGRARVCTKKDTYPDGREFVGYGIQPDITVAKTLEDFMKDHDPVLEAAIQYLRAR